LQHKTMLDVTLKEIKKAHRRFKKVIFKAFN